MADSSLRNEWVDKYLEALLGGGLSKEYVNRVDDGDEKDDEYGTLAANYWINLIFDDEQENIVACWRKAKAAIADADDSAARRRENQAWRIWSLMLAREGAQTQQAGPGESAVDLHDADSEVGGDSGTLASPSQSMGPSGHISWAPLPTAAPSTPSPGKPGPPSPKAAPAPVLTTRRSSGNCQFPLGGSGSLRISTAHPERDGSVTPKQRDGDKSPGTATSAQSERLRGENPFLGRVDRLYLVLISMHGLVRGENMELGKDADTGGQVKYVVELARTLAHHPMVYRVDLLSRLITNESVDESYGVYEERISEPNYEEPLSGAFIVRMKAGNPDVYIAKESLWPHVREFSDNALTHVARMQQLLQKQSSSPVALYSVHGHYSDAGEAGALIAHTLDVPMVLTGHSLGRNKLDHLLRGGTTSRKQIEDTYAISRRIEGEERALDAAMMVITSTQQEVDEQWGLYDGYRKDMAHALKYRHMSGRAMPHMEVIPPGLDFSSLKVELPADPMALFEELAQSMAGVEDLTLAVSDRLTDSVPHLANTGPTDLGLDDIKDGPDTPKTPGVGLGQLGSERRGGGGGMPRSASRSNMKRGISSASLAAMESLRAEPEIWQSVYKFLNNKAKPVILAMSRPDAKKNILTLVRAFGENGTLREIANLVLVMGNRSKIDSLAKGSQQVLTQVLKLIDEYDLYGSVAYPKAHTQADISDIYLLAKSTKGVFVNIALQEPFGLTLIEAAVHGAPIVATRHGGPVDIISTLKNGKLVEPTDSKATAQAILDIILDKNKWQRYSTNGIKNILAYSWPSHCIRYLKLIDEYSREDEPGLTRMMTRHRKRNSDTQLEAGSSFANAAETEQVVGSADELGDAMPAGTLGREPGIVSFGSRSRFNMSVPADQHFPFAEADNALNATDDISLSRRQDWNDAGRKDLRIASRSRVVYATMDTTFDMSLLAAALRLVLAFNASREASANSAAASGGGDTGKPVDPGQGGVAVGLLTTLTFTEVREELQKADVEPTALDFIVCSCGAYIMYVDVEGQWVADEAWEERVCHRWDKQLVMRSLTRMQVNRPSEHNSKVAPNSSNVMRMVRTADGADKNEGNGPLHVMLDFDPEDHVELKAVDNATLIDKVRKRTRRVGIRCTLTLQLIPEETQSDANTHSMLHATPLRSSRSLALRHIVQSRNFTMSDAVFLCTPASMHERAEKDGFTVVGSLCSDMAQLVEGAQKVVVVPPSRQMKLGTSSETDYAATARPANAGAEGGRDQKAFNRLKVSLKPFDQERVLVLKTAGELEGILPGMLSAPLTPLPVLSSTQVYKEVSDGAEQQAEQ